MGRALTIAAAVIAMMGPAKASVGNSSRSSAAPSAVLLQTRTSMGRGQGSKCSFDNEPPAGKGFPRYFWDATCRAGLDSMKGCLADGRNPECRWCGGEDYSDIYCPASWCNFDSPPHVPYYWDSGCSMGQLGCNADGKNVECRFCGEFPYNGSVACPKEAFPEVPKAGCHFANLPTTPFFFDATCEDGMLGCKADGNTVGCRFCGKDGYEAIPCPASLCTFPEESRPRLSQGQRYYWDPACVNQTLGCFADGIHEECRFCGFGVYEPVVCPAWASRD